MMPDDVLHARFEAEGFVSTGEPKWMFKAQIGTTLGKGMQFRSPSAEYSHARDYMMHLFYQYHDPEQHAAQQSPSQQHAPQQSPSHQLATPGVLTFDGEGTPAASAPALPQLHGHVRVPDSARHPPVPGEPIYALSESHRAELESCYAEGQRQLESAQQQLAAVRDECAMYMDVSIRAGDRIAELEHRLQLAEDAIEFVYERCIAGEVPLQSYEHGVLDMPDTDTPDADMPDTDMPDTDMPDTDMVSDVDHTAEQLPAVGRASSVDDRTWVAPSHESVSEHSSDSDAQQPAPAPKGAHGQPRLTAVGARTNPDRQPCAYLAMAKAANRACWSDPDGPGTPAKVNNSEEAKPWAGRKTPGVCQPCSAHFRRKLKILPPSAE